MQKKTSIVLNLKKNHKKEIMIRLIQFNHFIKIYMQMRVQSSHTKSYKFLTLYISSFMNFKQQFDLCFNFELSKNGKKSKRYEFYPLIGKVCMQFLDFTSQCGEEF